MPSTFGNANYQRKHDAARIVQDSGLEPLKEAIRCAQALRSSAIHLENALSSASEEDRAKLALALARCVPDEFNAWIKVAEFIHAKPKHIEVSAHVSYESLLDGTWKNDGNIVPAIAEP